MRLGQPSLLLFAVLLLAAAPRASAPADAAPELGWDYVLRFDKELHTCDVECCFRGYNPKRLVSGMPASLDAVSFLPAPGGARLVRRASDDSLIPRGLRRGAMCLHWRVDLRKMAALGGRRESGVKSVGRDLLFTPCALLLRPYMWPLAAHVTVRIDAPEGIQHAVPWPPTRTPATYTLDPQSTNMEGMFAVGRFDVLRDVVAGASVEIAILDAPHKASVKGIRTWVHAAVRAVAGLFGRFPTRKVVAYVQPVPGRHPPVVFGLAMRGGGGHVKLFLSNAAEDDALPGEWVGVHELMHLGMPWTFNAESWLQEGFVTYYQEVLRARAGMIPEREAWQNIHEGFARGRRRGGLRSLELESRDMGREHNYHRVYWAGAAMALRIDVALRRASGGKRSLDDMIRLWHRRHGRPVKPHRGIDLIRASDRPLGGPQGSRIAEALLASKSFPAVDEVYAALGLRVEGGQIELDDSAPLAAQRRAIMAPPAKAAPPR